MANKIDIKRGTATVVTVSPLLSSNAVLDEQVTLSWEQSSKVELKLNDFILFDGVKYTLNELPTAKKSSTRLWRYDAIFQAPIFDLLKVSFLYPAAGTDSRGDFPLTGTPDVLMGLLIANLNRVYPGVWSLGSVIAGEAKTLSFSEDDNCLSVLNKLASEYDTEISLSGYAVNLNKVTRASSLTLQYGSTLYDIERKSIERNSAVTRLRPFGSTRNIPADYRGGSPRLLLPPPLQYVERGVSEYGIIEGKKNFDHIYPRLASGSAGTITAVDDMLTFTDTALDFDINAHLLPGTPAKVKFLTGQCAGYECEIEKYTHAEKKITIITNKDDKGFEVPNAAVLPAVGDKYVLLDINMPASYRTAAENELKAAAEKWLEDNPPTKCEYTVTFSDVHARATSTDIRKNDMIPFIDSEFGINEPLRVVKVTKGVADPWNVKIDISNTIAKTTWERLTSDVQKNEEAVREIRGGLQQSFARNWRQVEELSGMIETLRADMLIVGNVQGQFEIKDTLFSPNYSKNANQFYATAGTLVHKMVPSAENPKSWIIPAYNNSSLVSGTAYYLYARCGKNTTNGTYVLSATPRVWDADPTYYYFLVGVLSSVISGARTLQTTYGFTQISGNQVTTGRIQSQDGIAYFDLVTGTIGGRITFTSTSGEDEDLSQFLDGVTSDISDTQLAASAADSKAQQAIDNAAAAVTDYNQKFAAVQQQIDGEVSNWFYDYSPTLSNYPASDWTTNAVKDRHIGDTFTNTQQAPAVDAGKSWRFVKNGTVYSWTQIADSDAVLALQKAAKAQATADGKSTTYLIQPTSYYLGDTWVLGADRTINGAAYKAGEILTATQDSATFNEAHWLKRVRYTDDSAVDNLQTSGINLLNNSEYPRLAPNDAGLVTSVLKTDEAEKYYRATPDSGKIVSLYGVSFPYENGKEYVDSIYVRAQADCSISIYASGIATKIWTLKAGVWTQIFTNSFRGSGGTKYMAIDCQTADSYIDYKKVKIEEGNKGTLGWKPSEADVQARIDAAKQAGIDAQNNLNTTNVTVDALNAEWGNATKDGIVSEAEAKAIEKYINVVNSEKAGLEATYNKLYVNTYLEGTAKTNLLNAKVTYFGAVDTLLNSINTAISDGKTTVTEKNNVDAKYIVYRTTHASLQSAIEEANKAIQTKIDQLSSDKVNNLQIDTRNLLLKSNLQLFKLEGENKYHLGSYFLNSKKPAGTYTIIANLCNWGGGFIGLVLSNGIDFIWDWFSGDDLTVKAKIIATKPFDHILFYHHLAGIWADTTTGNSYVRWACLYEGDVKAPMTWSEAPEDAEARLLLQKSRIDEILSDNIADPSEKQYLSNLWQEIYAEYPRYWNQAHTHGVDKSNYEAKYTALNNLLSPVLANLNVNTSVSGASIRTAFNQYYDTRAVLVNAVTNKVDAKAQDAAEAAAETAYLKAALGQESDVQGGLFLSSVIAAREGGKVRSYMNGLASLNNIAFAAGVDNFARKDDPNKPETQNVALRHDGSGKIGQLNIDKNGNLYTTSGGKKRLEINSITLPALAALRSGSQPTTEAANASKSFAATAAQEAYVFPNALQVMNNGSEVSIGGNISVSAHVSSIGTYCFAQIELQLLNADNSIYTIIDNVAAYAFGGGITPGTPIPIDTVENPSDSQTKVVDVTISGIPAGVYKLRVVYSRQTDGGVSTGAVGATNMKSVFYVDMRQILLGLNGIAAFYGANKHLYINEEETANQPFFNLRGTTDMPGVLAAGSSTAGGVQTNVWGAKSNPGGVSTISGGFRVPLRNMEHSNYVVQITPHTSTTFRVGTKTATYFEVYGTGGFDYVVIGKNYA